MRPGLELQPSQANRHTVSAQPAQLLIVWMLPALHQLWVVWLACEVGDEETTSLQWVGQISIAERDRLQKPVALLSVSGMLQTYPGLWRHDQHDETRAVFGCTLGKLGSKDPVLAKGRIEPYDELIARWQITCGTTHVSHEMDAASLDCASACLQWETFPQTQR